LCLRERLRQQREHAEHFARGGERGLQRRGQVGLEDLLARIALRIEVAEHSAG
jgi:hypothetical protein